MIPITKVVFNNICEDTSSWHNSCLFATLIFMRNLDNAMQLFIPKL